MTNYEKLRRKASFFRMFTGLSSVAFDKFVAEIELVWLARKAKRSGRRPRQRKPGAGRKAKLLLTDRLLLTLLCYPLTKRVWLVTTRCQCSKPLDFPAAGRV